MTEPRSSEKHSRCQLRRADDHALRDLIEQHRMICAIGRIITSEINLDLLFELIVKQITELMHVETCSVFLHDPASDELRSMVSSDCKKNRIRISTQCGIAGWVFGHRTPQIINAPYDDPRFFQGVDRKTGFRTRSMLCIPLVNRQKACIGTLQALNKKEGAFTEQDLDVLLSASHYVTIALENAKLYDDLKALDKVKQKVIHHLSHELKTPLAILKGSFQLIRKRTSEDNLGRIENALNRGTRSLERLTELQMKTDDILSHLKMEKDHQEPQWSSLLLDMIEEIEEQYSSTASPAIEQLKKRIEAINRPGTIRKEFVDVAAVLEEICKSVLSIVNKRNLCLMQHIDDRFRVFTDVTVFKKVCAGLLKNGIENTPDEGCIEVSTRTGADKIDIEFRDHGVGISEENQKMIFSGFFPTQATEVYASKKPYHFNAGGAGVDLLRIKTFADELNFSVVFKSRRCPALEGSGKTCPGRISACPFVAERSECLGQGGSSFVVSFPAGHRQTGSAAGP